MGIDVEAAFSVVDVAEDGSGASSGSGAGSAFFLGFLLSLGLGSGFGSPACLRKLIMSFFFISPS